MFCDKFDYLSTGGSDNKEGRKIQRETKSYEAQYSESKWYPK